MNEMEHMSIHEQFLKQAIDLARASLHSGGGPFGAVIVKEGEVIATGHNKVVLSHDPTAHAEIVAIRAAAKELKAHDLKGCSLYSSCEPCPMCLSAAYWAHIDCIWYSLTHVDAAEIGFDDAFIYQELCLPAESRSLSMHRVQKADAKAVFREWKEKTDKIKY